MNKLNKMKLPNALNRRLSLPILATSPFIRSENNPQQPNLDLEDPATLTCIHYPLSASEANGQINGVCGGSENPETRDRYLSQTK